MIYKKMSGRLGNQMFQYASTRGILAKNGIKETIHLDFSQVYKENFSNELEYFNIKYSKEVNGIKLNFKQMIVLANIFIYEKILKLKYKNIDEYEKHKNAYELKNQKKFNQSGVVKLFDSYMDLKLDKNKDYALYGLFESKKYFDHIRDELLEEFTPKNAKLKDNETLYQAIENNNSVCISVRRGDFLNPENKDRHFVCDMDYFKRAITKMKELIKNPQFIIFSDDIEWCKKTFAFLENALYESGKDPVWEKLRLMYSCKHFIISNSTFSWWAQYLSRNDSKIVIAPKKWKNFGVYEDIYDDNWIKI